MQKTKIQKNEDLRKRLPSKYAVILFSRYQRENLPFSRSLIYKVAAGNMDNTTILNDLVELVDQNERAKKRIAQFKKRLNKK